MINLITFLSAIWGLYHLIFYKRDGADYHCIVSFVAWCLMVLLFFIAMWVTVYGNQSCWQLALPVFGVSLMIYIAKGNVAKLIRYGRKVVTWNQN